MPVYLTIPLYVLNDINTSALIKPVNISVLNTTGHSIEFKIRLFLIKNARKIARDEKNRSSVKINHLGTMLIVLRKLIVFAGVVISGRFYRIVRCILTIVILSTWMQAGRRHTKSRKEIPRSAMPLICWL